MTCLSLSHISMYPSSCSAVQDLVFYRSPGRGSMDTILANFAQSSIHEHRPND